MSVLKRKKIKTFRKSTLFNRLYLLLQCVLDGELLLFVRRNKLLGGKKRVLFLYSLSLFKAIVNGWRQPRTIL